MRDIITFLRIALRLYRMGIRLYDSRRPGNDWGFIRLSTGTGEKFIPIIDFDYWKTGWCATANNTEVARVETRK